MYRHNPLAAASVSASIQGLSNAANELTRVCAEALSRREEQPRYGLSTALKRSFVPSIVTPLDMQDTLRKIK